MVKTSASRTRLRHKNKQSQKRLHNGKRNSSQDTPRHRKMPEPVRSMQSSSPAVSNQCLHKSFEIMRARLSILATLNPNSMAFVVLRSSNWVWRVCGHEPANRLRVCRTSSRHWNNSFHSMTATRPKIVRSWMVNSTITLTSIVLRKLFRSASKSHQRQDMRSCSIMSMIW